MTQQFSTSDSDFPITTAENLELHNDDDNVTSLEQNCSLNFTQPFNFATPASPNSSNRPQNDENFISSTQNFDHLVNNLTQAFDVSTTATNTNDNNIDNNHLSIINEPQTFQAPDEEIFIAQQEAEKNDNEQTVNNNNNNDNVIDSTQEFENGNLKLSSNISIESNRQKIPFIGEGEEEEELLSNIENSTAKNQNLEFNCTQAFDSSLFVPHSSELIVNKDAVDESRIEQREEDVDEIQSIASLSSPKPPALEEVEAACDENVTEPTTTTSTEQQPGQESVVDSSSATIAAENDNSNNDDVPQPNYGAVAPPQDYVEDEEEDGDGKKSEVGELIADIFGDSDLEDNGGETTERAAAAAAKAFEEGHEIESGDEEEITARRKKHVDDENDEENLPDAGEDGDQEEQHENIDEQELQQQQDDENDYEQRSPQQPEEVVSDFDLMMEKRRKQSQRWRRRKRDYEFVTYNDDMIAELLNQMKLAAKEDIDLNSMQMPATRKRSMLPVVLRELRKADLVSGFIEAGVVEAMAQWISPLPDKSLPALEIRTEFLKILQTFPTLDHQILRSSNIGKAVMLLFKHPKENKQNKERAQKLINEWARPIFNLQTDYRSLTKDERIKRDFDHMPVAKKRRLSLENEDSNNNKPTSSTNNDKNRGEKSLGPGDKGFNGRARVPRPSTKDYVVRPKWNVDTEIRKNTKKQKSSKIDKKIREIKQKSAAQKASHAVNISIAGNRMAV